ncbi:Uncharacterised protein [Mycobacteroides abscessus subsp. abscessus]|nr:Uncharacterised protein [Mycobacteroides abscessus subsp. abscessus]
MHVDSHPELLGEVEDHIDVSVTVGDVGFVVRTPTHHVGTAPQCLAHQVDGARRLENSLLRESDDLQIDAPTILVAQFEQYLDAEQPDDRVDIGMRSNQTGAVDDRLIDHLPCTGGDGVRGESTLERAGHRDRTRERAVAVGFLLVEERLVEVHVRFDQTRNHHAASTFDCLVRLSRALRTDLADVPAIDLDVDEWGIVRQPYVAQNQVHWSLLRCSTPRRSASRSVSTFDRSCFLALHES